MKASLKHYARDAVGTALSVLGVTRPERAARGRLTVVTFHRVLPEELRSDYAMPNLVVTPDELAWYLAFFTHHYTCGTLAQSVQRWRGGTQPARPLLAVTFDDGQRDNFEHARPVLAAAGVPASFFVTYEGSEHDATLWHDRLAYAARRLVQDQGPAALAETCPDEATTAAGGLSHPVPATAAADALNHARALVARAKTLSPAQRQLWLEALEARVGPDNRPDWDGMMSWGQLRTLAQEGHEIGSHTLSHALLPQCDDVELEREVGHSKRVLEERLGTPVPSFCYPNGDCDERTLAAVDRAGYSQAVTTSWGLNASGASPLRLQRCDMVAAHVRRPDGRPSATRLAWRVSGLYPGLGK